MQRDEQIFDLILEEQEDKLHGLELIASENFVVVRLDFRICINNKYAEGYPGKRYTYGL
jgi:glycine hydroxymethyltransferase